MKGFNLSKDEIESLRLAHKKCKNKRAAYKVNAILLLGTGWSLKKVKNALLIDNETLSTYIRKYKDGGIKELLSTNHAGRQSSLTDEQEKTLKQELENRIHLTTKSVAKFVNATFKITYSQSGMRDLLHRLGYTYKKPKLVPGKPDIDAQEEFVAYYEDFIMNKRSNEEVLFVDAVHPEHNAMAAYGWIKKGQERPLKTNSGRQRLNLHGAINAETYDVTIIEADTIDRDSTIQLLEIVRQKYFKASKIYVILDNARYHYSKEVREYLKETNIILVFIPPYSPNLNLIERFWKVFKKNVIYNQYYEDIKAFRSACIRFFKNISDHEQEIKNIMSADFHMA